MSIVQKKLFFFQLVDTNRQPLHSGTVNLTSDSVVDEFRKAIQADYANSFFKNVAAPDLHVFRNKDSLKKRLDPFHTLGELGKREDPLIVMVPPPVWFQLVGADRLPFNGSSVDALTLPRRSSTREFRDALKTKYADSHLKGIAPDTLKIFAPGAESPLEVDVSIGELGKSKNDTLIVLVPFSSAKSSGSTSFLSAEEDLPRKRQRIEISDLTTQLKSFANTQLVEGCIQSQDQAFLPYPQDEIKTLYVRKCYQDVFHLLIQHINLNLKSFAISGTPGIGKSLFFVYILHRLMADFRTKTLSLQPNRVVYQMGSTYNCFDLQQKMVTRTTKLDAEGLVREQDTFYVIDGRTSEPLVSSCVVLFISSPRSEWYKEFVKQKMAKEWYFPVWTLDELQTCQRHCYPDLRIETLQERHRIYGGVARFVFHKNLAKIMENALADVDAVRGVRNIGNPTKIFATSHTLLHVVVSNDSQYQFCHVDIASKYVGEQLWIRHSAQMTTNLQEMFGGSPSEISRHLFEIYGHMVFSVGGRTLKCRCLESGTVTEITLDALRSHLWIFGYIWKRYHPYC
jgi:hypothetical protein